MVLMVMLKGADLRCISVPFGEILELIMTIAIVECGRVPTRHVGELIEAPEL